MEAARQAHDGVVGDIQGEVQAAKVALALQQGNAEQLEV